MFCIKCGAKIEDGSKFCEECGAAQDNVSQPQEPSAQASTYTPASPQGTSYQSSYQNASASGYQRAPGKKNTALIIICAVVVVALIVLGVIFGPKLFGGSKYCSSVDDVVKEYIDCLEADRPEDTIALMPNDWVDAVCEIEGYESEEEFLNGYDYGLYMGYYGEEVENYEIYSDYEADEEDLANINDYYGRDKDKFTGGYDIYVDITFENGDTDTFGFSIASIGKQFYLLNTW